MTPRQVEDLVDALAAVLPGVRLRQPAGGLTTKPGAGAADARRLAARLDRDWPGGER
ncbi:hypothetical protein ACIQGZ_17445 [Streptomyces sp. NPDC092296]|uniref:hypothetical protein n=1 Tax=Streptomyces sp. NPDC092296 TaxID=3366012 RepID=UPI003810A088